MFVYIIPQKCVLIRTIRLRPGGHDRGGSRGWGRRTIRV